MLEQPLHELRGITLDAEAEERRLVRCGYHVEALGEQLPAAGGHLRRAVEPAVRCQVEGRAEAGQRRRRRPARVEARRSGLRDELALRLVALLREVARRPDPEPLGVGDDEASRPVRPAEPLLA